MSWVKLDDKFWSNRKVRRAGDSIAAYVLLLSWCGDEETNGHIPGFELSFICSGLSELSAKVEKLVEVGLLEEADDGYTIPDYLEFNFSREQLEERRETDRIRKEAARKKTAELARRRAESDRDSVGKPPVDTQESERSPESVRPDAERSPQNVQAASKPPVPSRPDPTPDTPNGVSERASTLPASRGTHVDIDRELSRYLLDRYAEFAGTEPLKVSETNLNDMRLLRERGPTEWSNPAPIDPRAIRSLVDWLFDHSATPDRNGFCWAKNIQSPGSLRRGWVRLIAERNTATRDEDVNAMAIQIGKNLRTEGVLR